MRRGVFFRLALLGACAALAPRALEAALGRRVAGSGLGGNSIYATDAYPGFDGLDDLPKAEKKERRWFLWTKRDTPAEQLAYADAEADAGNARAALRGWDALVREWPASPEAPLAQLARATYLAKNEQEYADAFEELDYLLDFYPRECNYAALVDYQYRLANLLVKTKRTFFGFSFTSTRVLRQHYEMIVRRAPGASYVPEAMLKIADLREQDQQYEEAVQVYGALALRFPGTEAARTAVYREARARMWLARRLAYNLPRCQDTARFLERAIARHPDLPEIEELKQWRQEVDDYVADDVWRRTRFYDSRQRTRHAAISAYERFLAEHPKSPHAEEARARIAELGAAAHAAARPAAEAADEKKE